jgi:hypothetical protein
MNSSEDIIRELEFRRRALNERLMNAKDVAEANGIERELWAVRARIRYHKAKMARGDDAPFAKKPIAAGKRELRRLVGNQHPRLKPRIPIDSRQIEAARSIDP